MINCGETSKIIKFCTIETLFIIISIISQEIFCNDLELRQFQSAISVPLDLTSQLSNFNCTMTQGVQCHNQFCGSIYKILYKNVVISENITTPHYQKNVILELGVLDSANSNSSQVTFASSGQSNSTYLSYSNTNILNTQCSVGQQSVKYFFRVSLFLTNSDLQFSTNVTENNLSISQVLYRYQINIRTCHPSCLQCDGPRADQCTVCQHVMNVTSQSNGACSCSTSTDYFFEGICYPQCPTNYGNYQNICIKNLGCSDWNANNGICITCSSGYFNFKGICQQIQTLPAGYQVINGTASPIITNYFPNITYYINCAFCTNDFSHFEVDYFQFNLTSFFSINSNPSLVSRCNQDQLLGGYLINKKGTSINFPSLTISSKYIQIIFKYYLIDFDSNYQNLNIYLTNRTSSIYITVPQNTTTQNQCGFDNADVIDNFQTIIKIDATPRNTVTMNYSIYNNSTYADGNSTQHGYLGIREVTVIGFDCSDINCKDCVSNNVCTQCNRSYYYNTTESKCKSCTQNCAECNDGVSCNVCNRNYQVHQTTKLCVQCSTLEGYYISGNFCQKCDSTCKQCNGQGNQKCTSCLQGFYLNLNFECAVCPSNCLECSGTNGEDCSICQDQYFVLDQTTKHCEKCPNEAYLDSSSLFCKMCQYQCIVCDDVRSKFSKIKINSIKNNNETFCLVCSCSECFDQYFKYNQIQCTKNCNLVGNNYSVDYTSKTCKCEDGYNYQLYNNVTSQFDCYNSVPQGFYCNEQNMCFNCKDNCIQCRDNLTCQKCNEGNYLWDNSCYFDCFPSQNIIPNLIRGQCECIQGYTLTKLDSPIKGSNYSCLLELQLDHVQVYNSMMQSKEISLPAGNSNNIMVFSFNRQLTESEFGSFSFRINQSTSILNRDYQILSTKLNRNTVEAEIETDENRRIKEIQITLLKLNTAFQPTNTILVSKSYVSSSSSGVKGLTSSLESLNSAFAPTSNGAGKSVVDFLKTFQILCTISNFVQVLALIYLIRDYLPAKIKYASLFGASLVFKQTPPASSITFNNLEGQYLSNTLNSLGLTNNLYHSFTGVHVILSVSSILVLLCLITRTILKGQQHTLLVVNKIVNFLCSYLQSSITGIFFSITYSYKTNDNISLPIFQIIVNALCLVEMSFVVITNQSNYLLENLPNIFDEIDHAARGSKSYLIVSFLKKYSIVLIHLNFYNRHFICAVLSSIIFGLSGFYILYYRFFKRKLMNLLKIIQEFLISLLFAIISRTIQEMRPVVEDDIISSKNLEKTEQLGDILLMLMILCLSISFLIFLIRTISSIIALIQKIKQQRQLKRQKQIEMEQLQNSYPMPSTNLDFLSSSLNKTNNKIKEN